MLRATAIVVCVVLGAALVAAKSSTPSDEVTLFDAKGGHNSAENLRQCYDTMRRAAACPLSKRKNQQQQTIVGTRKNPIVCAADEVDGTFMIRVTYMLLRTISKSYFVKNAFFTGPVNGKKPTNQHFLDVFLGQLVFNVLNAAERSVIDSLATQKPTADPEEAKVKAAWETLALPQNMWASVKWGTFQGKKERIAIGSKAFRDAIRTVRLSKKPLFRTCRRVKFVIASMDVGADVAKYALAKKWAIATLIKKIITTVATIGAGAVPIGGQAVGALVGVVSDLVDSYIDAAKEKMNRKYAVQDIVLQLLSAMIPPKEDTPPIEAMLTGTTAQSTEISNALKSIMSKMGIPYRRGKKGKTGGVFRSHRGRVFDSNDQESAVERYPFQEFDASLLQLSDKEPDMFSTTQYATDDECNTQVGQMLYIIENMLEDDVTNNGAPKEEVTDTYQRINYCGPNPNVMSEKENVLRCKSEFKLIKYFISVPDASSVEAESWLSKVSSRTEKLIDTAEKLHEEFTASSSSGEDDGTSAE